jgi:radical SAM protein with 4Fe4S-binding SPASM domain
LSRISKYLKSCDEVVHTTLNPYGPGAVRIHMIPPGSARPGVPWVIILNGQYILPINTSWAILLAEFIREANKSEGRELLEDDIKALAQKALDNVKAVFPKTKDEMLRLDLSEIIETLVKLSRGEEVNSKIGLMTLADYAKYMTAPHRLDLMVSSMYKNAGWHCNQRCLHCYAANQPLGRTQELSTEDWYKIIDKCRLACIPQLTFTGGEPTLRPDLVPLIAHASWFVTRLNTNGQLLTEGLCRELYKASLDSVQITLYSHDAEIHNRLVGAKGFDNTVNGIKNALRAGLNVSINTPLCTLNKDYAKTVAFAADLGVKYFTCSGLILTGGAAGSESASTRLDGGTLYDILEEATDVCAERHLELSFTSPGWLDELVLKELNLTIPSCGACLSNMAVAPDGTVVPCQSWLDGKGLGNLLTENWSKIWKSKDCLLIRRETAKSQQVCPLNEKAGTCR